MLSACPIVLLMNAAANTNEFRTTTGRRIATGAVVYLAHLTERGEFFAALEPFAGNRPGRELMGEATVKSCEQRNGAWFVTV